MKRIQVGLRLRRDAFRIQRHPATTLAGWLADGHLVHLVGPRQTGKSTLIDGVARDLVDQGVFGALVQLDLGHFLSPEAGGEFGQVCSQIAKQLGVADETRAWRQTEGISSDSKDLLYLFLQDVALPRIQGRLLIVIDEIDDLKDPFNDEFFIAIRGLLNTTSDDPQSSRLTFCLVGSRPAAWLVRDPQRTRINVGRKLILGDYTEEETREFLPYLATACGGSESRAEKALNEIFGWTHGHPLLTAEILEDLLEGPKIPLWGEKGRIDDVVHRLYLDDGLANHNTLVEVQLRALRDEPQSPVEARLETYERMLRVGPVDYRSAEPTHEALLLDGLVALADDGADRYLVPRNLIFSRVFDLDWVRRGLERAALTVPPPPTPAPSPETVSSLTTVQDLVDRLIPKDSYERLDEGTEELENLLYSFSVSSLGNVRQLLRLQVYCGLSGAGADLWEQEVRALERLSGTHNATLPVLYEAGIDEDLGIGEDSRGVAYTLTEAGRVRLSDSGELEKFRETPAAALREFLLLAKGLMALQRQSLIHRNLWNGNIELVEGDDGTWSTLRLARFQMSILLSNMLRRLDGEMASFDRLDRLARRYFRNQGSLALGCAPPERLAFVFDRQGMDSLESAAGDVYSLGMIGYQLFVGPLPDRYLSAAFPESESGFQEPAFRNFHREIRARCHRAPHRKLAVLLADMLEFKSSLRPTIYQVVQRLQADYESIQNSFQIEATEKFYLAYIQKETGQQFHVRGWMVHDPSTREGAEELHDLLEQDLRNARMTYSETGATAYVANPDQRHEEAKYVLLGRKATYFGLLFEDRRGSVSGPRLPQVFLTAFACDSRRTWRLQEQSLQRPLPAFELVSSKDPRLTPQSVRDRPDWLPFLNSVTRKNKNEKHKQFEEAIEWLLEVQRCQQTVRQYPVVAVLKDFAADDDTEPSDSGPGRGRTWELELDSERDRQRLFRDTFLTFYAADRPSLGDFFDQQRREEGSRLLFELEPWDSRWLNSGKRYEVFFKRRIDDRRVEVESEIGLPAKGWLRTEAEIGTVVQYLRQKRARSHLLEMPNLVSQFIQPRTVRRRRRTWQGASDGLRGDAGKIIRSLLDTRPFFALQGPPGTGKTTVTSRAVALALKADRSQRILVSAQSHFALDHVASRIVEELRRRELDDIVPLRIASELGEDRVDDEIKPYLPKRRVENLLARIRGSANRIESQFHGRPELLRIAAEWRRTAPARALEIQDRLRRGANILFATTGTATPDFLGLEDESSACDWVILEEAGKAWATELAMPLVQARRWTLIGDHLQLPPFGREQLVDLVERCQSDPDPEIQKHGERREAYLRYFDLFGSLFASDPERHATARLDLQFRMAKTIGDAVSHAFYENELETDESAGQGAFEVQKPPWLRGYRLLWIESGKSAREEPTWSNAREVAIVKHLVEQLMKNRPEPDPSQLAILSPYLKQCDALEKALGQNAKLVHTVDSFQGKEADIVIVSLVRVNRMKTSRERLGFLSIPNRINVMLSRARGLLVLVGSFEHFKNSGVDFWEKICADVVTHGGGVMPARLTEGTPR